MKRHLRNYLLITFVLSFSYTALIIESGGVRHFGLPGLVFMMWIPGLVALLYRKYSGLGFDDAGWKWGALKYQLLAVAVPLLLALLTNLICVGFSVRKFSLLAQALWPKFGAFALLSMVAGIFGALGEELGWRGFLVPKLYQAKVKRPLLTSGLIWAFWHLPLITLGHYYKIQAPFLIGVTYSLTIVGLGYFIGWLRIVSGSVWVATLAHASHNFFFQLAITYSFFGKEGVNGKYWEVIGGDAGIVPALLYFAVIILGYRLLKLPTAQANS